MTSQDLPKPSDKLNRWIVVTSIQYPTEDIKRLAEMPGWNLVVVGDSKTPSDWNLTGVHYLSIDSQLRLNLSTPVQLPTNSYTRKNVGYLYAIQHGAGWIYDTDDDNKPYGEGLDGFDYNAYVSGLRYNGPSSETSTLGEKLFNPYRFYGRAEMWPRGFPLDAIQYHKNNNTMMNCARMCSPAVQQGLVHNDPDVDAIYRLLNANRKTGLSDGFNPYAPPIQLDKGVYSPWNSQNTLFHRRAFFTLFLPTSVAFRVTDIWRSYFSQRLLHLIGENIAFYPVNAVQNRNAHDYLKDFKDEKAVYEQSAEIVNFLDAWDCKRKRIEDCTIELADAFAKEKFWGEVDAQLVRTWIMDLKAIGYEFPPIRKTSEISYIESLKSANTYFRSLNCRRAKLSFQEPRAATEMSSLVARAEEKIQNWREISDWCKEANYSTLLHGIGDRDEIVENHRRNAALHHKLSMALVVVNNYPWRFSMGLLQRMYEPYFATVIFCGTIFHNDTTTKDLFPKPRDNINYIHLMEKEVMMGHYIYQCASRVNQLRLRNITGIVVMSDDVMFHQWHSLDEDLVAHAHGLVAGNYWWDVPSSGELLSGKEATALLVKNLNGVHMDNSMVQDTWIEYENRLRSTGVIKSSNDNATAYITRGDGKAISDWFYIPSRELSFYQRLTDLFAEARLFLEIAVAKYLRAVQFQYFPEAARSLWGTEQRLKWPEVYNKDMIMLHAVKLSEFADVSKRWRFCEKIAQLHVNVTLKFENYTDAKSEKGCPTEYQSL